MTDPKNMIRLSVPTFIAGLLIAGPELVLIALALALMPVVQRPRGSLALGIAVAALSAFGWLFVVMLLLRAGI